MKEVEKMKYVPQKNGAVICTFCCKELPRCPIAIFAHSHDKMFASCSEKRMVKYTLYKSNRRSDDVFVDELFVWN